MLIKIGDALVNPEEIAAMREEIDNVDKARHIVTRFKNAGDDFVIEGTMDEAEAALIDAGVIENPYPEAEDEAPALSEEESAELRALHDLGCDYIARDADGRVYAYKEQPVQDDGYFFAPGSTQPVKADAAYAFLDFGEAMSISWLLLG